MTADSSPSENQPTESGDAALRTAVKREFIVQVILLNLGILAVGLGSMLFYFRGLLAVGAGLIGGGLVVIGLAYRRYRTRPPNG